MDEIEKRLARIESLLQQMPEAIARAYIKTYVEWETQSFRRPSRANTENFVNPNGS